MGCVSSRPLAQQSRRVADAGHCCKEGISAARFPISAILLSTRSAEIHSISQTCGRFEQVLNLSRLT